MAFVVLFLSFVLALVVGSVYKKKGSELTFLSVVLVYIVTIGLYLGILPIINREVHTFGYTDTSVPVVLVLTPVSIWLNIVLIRMKYKRLKK
ncbi:hypothetical protein SAMN05421839_1327 [Halolactibacillus halophilus]|uniref:Uncharacterized protein n=1 Tax=Halolactibacillus halophilus TaxID=306540 RepID=A0A1I5RMR4_9BACI|nr:hypothetical protein [Halolactibacillus halophilus]GEM02422.1 hypothetical protein HHA03_19540 [Halolactibacillus halophilus]SFP59680.1 hypothetical protein SAMN05421839_1327 [Halolactibacillus halophilus]